MLAGKWSQGATALSSCRQPALVSENTHGHLHMHHFALTGNQPTDIAAQYNAQEHNKATGERLSACTAQTSLCKGSSAGVIIKSFHSYIN